MVDTSRVKTPPGQNTPQSPVPPRQLRPAVRAVWSLLIALHVLAVFVGPWALPPNASDLAGNFARLMRPYLHALSLDNG